MVCSLLYEIISGKPTNEGLAGAINRFARSNERREIDKNEIEDAPAGFPGVMERAVHMMKLTETRGSHPTSGCIRTKNAGGRVVSDSLTIVDAASGIAA
jgi:hypothetical protein